LCTVAENRRALLRAVHAGHGGSNAKHSANGKAGISVNSREYPLLNIGREFVPASQVLKGVAPFELNSGRKSEDLTQLSATPEVQ
jgi:hypothetical protein